MTTGKRFVETWPGVDAGMFVGIRATLHEEQSAYQKIQVFDSVSFGTVLALDGCFMVTNRDHFFYHEMMTHPALLRHPDPKRVLIIGGGDCGCLHETLKHDSVAHVDLVEIDERVTRVCEQYFPQLCASNDDPRVHFQFVDGIQWVRECTAERYDVLIVDSTDPVGPAQSLFTRSFYEQCRRVLTPGGILCAQSESPLLYPQIIRKMDRDLRAADFLETTLLSFPMCTYPSGWWSATLSFKATPAPARNPSALSGRTRYFSAAIAEAAAVKPPLFQDHDVR